MKRAVILVSAMALPMAVHAQSVLSTTVRAGYTVSGSFGGKNGGSGTLMGPEVGIDVPLGAALPISGLGPLQFSFSPSYFFGGANSNSDYRGNVYRLVAAARLNMPSSPLYFRLGAGFAYANPSDGDFNSHSAYETQLTLGYGILNNLPGIKLSAEVTYNQSSLAQASGFMFGLSFRF